MRGGTTRGATRRVRNEGRRERRQVEAILKGLPRKYLCSETPRDGGSSNSNDKTVRARRSGWIFVVCGWWDISGGMKRKGGKIAFTYAIYTPRCKRSF